jgi:proteasome lid subunit RPN8/RPN11
VLPDEPLSIAPAGWDALVGALHERTQGVNESGAFLLGRIEASRRRVVRPVYYDELDPGAYRHGIVEIHADSFTALWAICRAEQLAVVADVHVHPWQAWQSLSDRENPMIARAGHLAMILPWFAQPPIEPREIGLYRYRGGHCWDDLSGRRMHRHFLLED